VIPEANKKETAARCAGKREDGDIRPLFCVLLFLLRKRELREKAEKKSRTGKAQVKNPNQEATRQKNRIRKR